METIKHSWHYTRRFAQLGQRFKGLSDPAGYSSADVIVPALAAITGTGAEIVRATVGGEQPQVAQGLFFSALANSLFSIVGNYIRRDETVPIAYDDVRRSFVGAKDEIEIVQFRDRGQEDLDAEKLFEAAADFKDAASRVNDAEANYYGWQNGLHAAAFASLPFVIDANPVWRTGVPLAITALPWIHKFYHKVGGTFPSTQEKVNETAAGLQQAITDYPAPQR